jgi:hypothetical protein
MRSIVRGEAKLCELAEVTGTCRCVIAEQLADGGAGWLAAVAVTSGPALLAPPLPPPPPQAASRAVATSDAKCRNVRPRSECIDAMTRLSSPYCGNKDQLTLGAPALQADAWLRSDAAPAAPRIPCKIG